MSAALGRVGLGLLLLAAGAAAAGAHVGGSTGYASIMVSRSTVRYTLVLPTAALPSDLAEAFRLAQTGSQQNRDKLLDVLRRQIVLRANGTRCEPGPGQVVPSAFDATSFTMQLDFACGSAVRDLVVEDNIFDVLGPDHHTLAKVEADGETRELAFAPESREARVSVGVRDAARAEASFIKLGVEHILTGYDHLLFLGALLLRGGRLLSLFKIITAFTVAHSITLALAVLGLVTLPEQLIECVIAASIVYVALVRFGSTSFRRRGRRNTPCSGARIPDVPTVPNVALAASFSTASTTAFITCTGITYLPRGEFSSRIGAACRLLSEEEALHEPDEAHQGDGARRGLVGKGAYDAMRMGRAAERIARVRHEGPEGRGGILAADSRAHSARLGAPDEVRRRPDHGAGDHPAQQQGQPARLRGAGAHRCACDPQSGLRLGAELFQASTVRRSQCAPRIQTRTGRSKATTSA